MNAANFDIPVTRLRVLQVLHTLNRAGAERLVYEFALANRDHIDTAVLTLDQLGPLADQLQAAGVDVHFTHRRDGIDVSQIFKIARIIKSFNPDVIHCHQYTPFFYAALAALAARSRARILFTEHGRHFPDIVSSKRRLFNRFLVSRAAHITAVCDFARRGLVASDAFPPDRVEVLYNGVDLERFENLPPRDQARALLHLPPDVPLILHVGTFRPVKNQSAAIQAFKFVRDKIPNALIAFVGDGPDLPACSDLVARLNLVDAVFFLGQRDDIPTVLAAADLFIMTSRSEAHSVSILEAMAAAIPVVATDVGGIPETVLHNRTGLLVPPNDSSALASALVQLLNDPVRRAEFGSAARNRVREKFLRSDMHRRYLEIYNKLSSRGKPS